MSKVKTIITAHPTTGLVITEAESSNGNKYGKYMVQSAIPVVNKEGFFSFQKRAAFITVGEDQLEGAKAFLTAGMEVPFAGRIQRVESRTPQYEGHSPKVIPADKKKGTEEQEYLLEGAPVYFQDLWNPDTNCEDTLLVGAESTVEEEASAEMEA